MDRPSLIGSGEDLSAEVTTFVTTVGGPTFAECVAHLERQDCITRFDVIEGVAPLTAALQLMIDRCTTPFFVQVDEDMLLEQDAIRRLHTLILREWHDVAVLVGLLEDPHLGRTIEGVKIHRLAHVRRFPWNEYQSVLERNRAMTAASCFVARRPLKESGERLVFGRHLIDPTPGAVFERYRYLERLRLSQPDEIEWFASYPGEFLHRVLNGGTEIDFYALMGILAAAAERRGADPADGMAAPPPKDYRRMRSDPTIETATSFLISAGLLRRQATE